MKEEKLQLIPQKYKGCKKLLWITICQNFWKCKWSGQILEKHNLPKLNDEWAESLNRLITASEIEALIKKLLAYKPWAGHFHRRILSNI